MIAEYIAKVKTKINQIRWLIKNESFQVELPEETRIGYLKGDIVFIDDSRLFFAEIVSPDKKSYRFHYMDKNNHLIQRWDTAPHHKETKTYPFHTHTPKAVFESKPLNLLQILDIISDSIRKSL